MPPAARVPIRPSLLVWARTRAGVEKHDLERMFPRYGDWESGHLQPTLRQLEQFAAKTRAPLGYLFLEEPPEERLPIADFRTVGERTLRLSPDLLETVYAIQRRRDFTRDLLIDEGAEPLPFVRSASHTTPPDALARAMKEVLGLSPRWAQACATWQDALQHLRERLEAVGIFVMSNGVVGNNTSRPLSVQEFRGFVLVDPYAPVIFLNNADAKSAQMFTIVHEAAHVWLGEEGVSGLQMMRPGENAVERHCDAVAAEFLVPAAELLALWPRDTQPPLDACDRLSRKFKVSPLVVARRALDLGFLDQSDFSELYPILASRVRPKSNGGDFYATAGSRLGQRFPALVYASVQANRLSWTDAYDLTDLHGRAFSKFGTDRGYMP